MCVWVCVWFCLIWLGLASLFNGISNFVSYLMSEPSFSHNSVYMHSNRYNDNYIRRLSFSFVWHHRLLGIYRMQQRGSDIAAKRYIKVQQRATDMHNALWTVHGDRWETFCHTLLKRLKPIPLYLCVRTYVCVCMCVCNVRRCYLKNGRYKNYQC